MQNISFIALCALLFCTTVQARATQFIEHSTKIEKACKENLKSLPLTQWLDLGANTGQSPMTIAAICYRDKIKLVVTETKYQHASVVNNFAEAVVKIAKARDENKINTRTAMSLYRGLSSEFRTFIALDDAEAQLRESKRVTQNISGVMASIIEVKSGG